VPAAAFRTKLSVEQELAFPCNSRTISQSRQREVIKVIRRIAPSVFIAAFLVFATVSTSSAQDDKRLEKPDIEVEVGGLSCPFCAYGIEKRFKKIDGAENITVLLEEGLVQLKMKKGFRVTEERLRKAVEEAGFETKGLKFLNEGVKADATSF
jgi:copper chaperone CopZ